MEKDTLKFFMSSPIAAMGTVTKKNKEKRNSEIAKIKDYVNTYPYMAIVRNPNIPNLILKRIRDDFSEGSKIVFIRKKMARAVYNMPELPKDPFFLMFGDKEIMEKAREYQYEDFLEAGDVCPIRAVVEAQVVRDKEMIKVLPVSMKDGQMRLMEDYVVCEANESVDETKAKILRLFGQRLRKRSLSVLSVTETAALLEKQ